MDADELVVELDDTVAIRGWIRALMWLVLLCIVAMIGLVVLRPYGALIGGVLTLGLAAYAEWSWAAHRPAAKLRLAGGVLELPIGLFLRHVARVPVTDVTRASLSGHSLCIEAGRHASTIPLTQIIGGEAQARAIVAAVEAALERVAVGRSSALRDRARLAEVVRQRPMRVTTGLVGVVLLAFGGEWLYVHGQPDAVGLVELGANSGARVMDGELWRLVTANFLHASYAHVFGNVTNLMLLGSLMERMLGPRRLVAVLVASGLAGTTASALLHAPEYISVGASTMVYGLVGLMIVVHRRLGHAVPVECRPSPRGLAVTPLVELSMWALVPNIDGWAHVGGLLGGIIAAAWVVPSAESFGRELAALVPADTRTAAPQT